MIMKINFSLFGFFPPPPNMMLLTIVGFILLFGNPLRYTIPDSYDVLNDFYENFSQTALGSISDRREYRQLHSHGQGLQRKDPQAAYLIFDKLSRLGCIESMISLAQLRVFQGEHFKTKLKIDGTKFQKSGLDLLRNLLVKAANITNLPPHNTETKKLMEIFPYLLGVFASSLEYVIPPYEHATNVIFGWFKDAASRGDPYSCYRLCYWYHRGDYDSVPKNSKLALQYCKMAFDRGIKAAKKLIDIIQPNPEDDDFIIIPKKRKISDASSSSSSSVSSGTFGMDKRHKKSKSISSISSISSSISSSSKCSTMQCSYKDKISCYSSSIPLWARKIVPLDPPLKSDESGLEPLLNGEEETIFNQIINLNKI